MNELERATDDDRDADRGVRPRGRADRARAPGRRRRCGSTSTVPDGVDLALCERVTGELRDLLERYSLEVSSPGADRPLTKPEHFRRFLGRKVKVRTSEAIAGRRNFTGTLTDADDEGVCVDADGRAVRIPLAGIRRSNLIPEFGGGSA